VEWKGDAFFVAEKLEFISERVVVVALSARNGVPCFAGEAGWGSEACLSGLLGAKALA
jgi:hypothetical protein